MKKSISYMWLAAACIVLSLASCTEEDGAYIPESKGEETVLHIAEALKTTPEVSQFVEMLKTVDFSEVNEDKLTVFAVKNNQSVTTSRAEELDSVSIKRHIAVGSYSKSELTDGLVLKSVNGESLYIAHGENDVFVNGVKIEGEEMPVGNSYVYMVPEVFESKTSPVIPEDSVSIGDIRYLWNKSITAYADKSWIVEASLTSGYGGFTFNEIKELSSDFWTSAHKTLEEGEKFLADINGDENGKNLSDTIKTDLALIKTQLYTYYGTYIGNGHICSIKELEQECNELVNTLPASCANAVTLLLAKAYLCSNEYALAQELCNKLMTQNSYELSSNPYIVNSKESLWKGYEGIVPTADGGKAEMYPLLYREVLLIKGIAGYALGRNEELIEVLSLVSAAFGSGENITLNDLLFYTRSTGETYPYYKILTNIGITEIELPFTEGFESPKHLLLPIPESAFSAYPELIQNPGY